MLRSLLKGFAGRRLVRFLPGGWLAMILLSPPVRNAVKRRWQARRDGP